MKSIYRPMTFFYFECQDYSNKWWVCFTNTDFEYERKSFKYKKERTEFINKLKKQGYEKIKTFFSE